MDNIFEYLIYGFIIISFINSLFKKKKPVPKKPSEQAYHQRIDQTENKISDIPVSQRAKEQEYDILKEIEGFFNVGQPRQTATEVHNDKNMFEGAENREKFIPVPEKSFHTRTTSEHTFTNQWEVKRKELEERKKKLTPKIEEQASAYEESLKRKESAATKIIRDINIRLKNPSTLKEYVIISEIIGKPKALRR